MPGSSPLTRGKRWHFHGGHGSHRLIPAHAGKTVVTLPLGRASPAHPRSRGENDGNGSIRALSAGSSPLTRGKRGPRGWPARPARLIPAHAGKTFAGLKGKVSSAAHPRSRGENSTEGVSMSAVTGSSPLTRGKLCGASASIARLRLIPAHAGKTPSRRRRRNRGAAHPRSRGENHLAALAGRRNVGSSPLTRGKHLRGQHHFPASGLIPAHAGKTRCRQ